MNTCLVLLFLAEKTELTGLAIGILSMKSGERALLHVSWELGYGKEGSFSFPNVPPMADLLYEVELIGVDETDEVFYNETCALCRMMHWKPLFQLEVLEVFSIFRVNLVVK